MSIVELGDYNFGQHIPTGRGNPGIYLASIHKFLTFRSNDDMSSSMASVHTDQTNDYSQMAVLAWWKRLQPTHKKQPNEISLANLQYKLVSDK